MKHLLIITLILTGCSAVGNVQPISGNTHSVTSSGHYTSWSELKTSCIQSAREFCATENKQSVIVDWETHGVRGWSPQEGELTFNCIE